MSSKKSAKQSHWPLSALGAVTSILNAFLPLSLVRVLTPDEVGQYKLLFFYVTMIPMVAMTSGISSGLFFWAGNDKKRTAAFQTSWTLLLLIAFTVLILGTAFHTQLVHWLGWNSTLVWVFVWTAFITVVSLYYEDTKIATGQIWRGALFSSSFEFVRNASIIIVALKYRTIDAVMWTYAVVLTAKTLCGVVLGFLEGYQRPTWDTSNWRAVIRYAAPVSIASLLAGFTGYGDQIILSTTLTAAEFGVYTLGCLTVPPLLIFEISVNRILIPNMSSAFSVGNPRRALAQFRESVGELGWLLIPSAFGLSLFAKPIVLLLFKEKFLHAADFLQIYAFSYIAYVIPYDVVARARGDGRWILKFLAIFSPLSMVALYIGVNAGGALGTLVALMSVQFTMRASSLMWVSKKEGWKISEMVPWRQIGGYALLAAIATAAGKAVNFWIDEPLLWFACGGILFSIIYLAGTMPDFFRRRSRNLVTPPVMLLTRYLGMDEHARALLGLSGSLANAGEWNPFVFVYDKLPGAPTLNEEFKTQGLKVMSAKTRGGFSPLLVFRLAKEVLRNKVAIIHSHGGNALVYAVLVKWLSFGAVKVVHTPTSSSRKDKGFFAFFVDSTAVFTGEKKHADSASQYEKVFTRGHEGSKT